MPATTSEFIRSMALLLVLLNPFLVIVYLANLLENLDRRNFARVLLRAGVIATVVFCAFAILGDAVFSNLLQAKFASFQIFGGIVFLIIGIQFALKGPDAIEVLRGESAHLSGAVAMPILIGPGTVSASVVVGKRLLPLTACLAVVAAVTVCIATMILLKVAHDYVRPRREILARRYIEIAGRVTALVAGTIAIEMIMTGIGSWVDTF